MTIMVMYLPLLVVKAILLGGLLAQRSFRLQPQAAPLSLSAWLQALRRQQSWRQRTSDRTSTVDLTENFGQGDDNPLFRGSTKLNLFYQLTYRTVGVCGVSILLVR